MFQDQHAEFSELQHHVGVTQAKLQQLEALLKSLPPPRSQVSPGAASAGWALPSQPCPLLPSLLSPFPTLPFQKEAHVAARVRREFEKKRAVSGELCLVASGPVLRQTV